MDVGVIHTTPVVNESKVDMPEFTCPCCQTPSHLSTTRVGGGINVVAIIIV